MIDIIDLEKELPKALELIDENWVMQDNEQDKRSKFIYTATSVKEVIEKSKENKIDIKYALHRWYNYHTSITCEKICVDYGAKKVINLKDKEKDIYINHLPYDVKLTVYPKKLYNKPYNLYTRKGKNEMIKWMYENQSQEGRKHLKNRLFIVCDGKTAYDNLCLKSNFNLIRDRIEKFMNYSKTNGLNKIDIKDGNNTYTVYSDIIYIKED